VKKLLSASAALVALPSAAFAQAVDNTAPLKAAITASSADVTDIIWSFAPSVLGVAGAMTCVILALRGMKMLRG